MTIPAIQESYKWALWYGDAGGTNFTFLGEINDVDFNQTAAIAKVKVRDNAQPYAPPTQLARGTSLDAKISGSGYYSRSAYEAVNAIFKNLAVRQWRVSIYGGNTEQGAYIISELDLKSNDATGDGYGDMSISLELASGVSTTSVTPA